jgi:tripartite-type tricarboxylate transporter receptor subunit TctC
LSSGFPPKTYTGPACPSRWIATAADRGGNDVSARIIAQGLTERFGQQVIVDNRGGAHVPANTVAKAAPDGYTILVQNNTVWVAPLLEKTAYDHFRELAPITLTARAPNVLVVHPSLPFGSARELRSAGIKAE